MTWQLLVLSLPTENATARMRAWRALKAAGAAVLRDGVYLLPEADGHSVALRAVADDVRANGGDAQVFTAAPHDGADHAALFDRGPEFGTLLAEIGTCRAALDDDTAPQVLKQARKLRKAFEQLAAIDFFPGEAQRQTAAALKALEADAALASSADEPHAGARAVARVDAARYRGRVWATRRRPWVDRLASAWLIRRFIDPQARFVWLESPADCPKRAIGFDFDGATFTHSGAMVTFETLLASFDLRTPALLRLGVLVHALDLGGVIPPEAAGVERVLAGMQAAIADDDQLVLAAAGVFEGLLVAFEKDQIS
ncbi:MAG TPA: chromate resistance protein ChrB domain-containing protein [Burkholderiaceae bacterium]|nr:chromate resistance protein ChrB domain-containing protein [Burkholderiaceae bacterium]